MIRHVVMWKMKERAEGASGRENAERLRAMIEALRARIPQILELEIGFQMEPSESAYDVVLVSSFRTKADLELYQRHPEHQKVVTFVGSVTGARAVVDYEH